MSSADNNNPKEELETFKASWVDSEMEIGRNRIFDFAMDDLDPKVFFGKKLETFLTTAICT